MKFLELLVKELSLLSTFHNIPFKKSKGRGFPRPLPHLKGRSPHRWMVQTALRASSQSPTTLGGWCT